MKELYFLSAMKKFIHQFFVSLILLNQMTFIKTDVKLFANTGFQHLESVSLHYKQFVYKREIGARDESESELRTFIYKYQ